MFLPKIDFSIPKKNSVILFDERNFKYIKKYIINKNYYLIKIRNKNIHFFAFIYALVFFYKSNFKIEYINFFLNFSKKKVLISQNFNRLILYQLKLYYPDIKIIIIQNGVINNRFINLLKKTKYNKLTCDYFCCFSDVERIILQKYIKANYLTIGSIKNNFYKIKTKKYKKKEVLYISQYRNNLLNKKEFFNLYKNEKLILPIIYEFCQKKNIIFSILPGDDNFEVEKMHYRKILNTGNFKIYERNLYKSYSRVDGSLFSIGINSTLIFEALARKKKVGIFNFLENTKNKDSPYILFEKEFNNEGNFWIKRFNKKKIVKILNYLFKVSDKKWLKHNNSKTKLLLYDTDNSMFKFLLKRNLK